MSNPTWDRKRIRKTALGGLGGYFVGSLAERVIEGVTGLDIANGLLETAGVIAGVIRANKDILPEMIDKVRQMFGKGPAGLTKEEWDEFCRRYPQYAETVRRYSGL